MLGFFLLLGLAGCWARTPSAISPAELAKRGLPASLTLHTFDLGGHGVAEGSGFLLSDTGLAATNLHVLMGGQTAQATLPNGRLFDVIAVVGFDPWNDIAIFQIGRVFAGRVTLPNGLTFATLGDSHSVGPGDRLVAIGSPQGLSATVADGLLSGRRPDGLLQVSVPTSPGSSGSALYGPAGRVVGMSTLMLTAGQNVNFAVPAEAIRAVVSRPREFVPLPSLWNVAAGALMVSKKPQAAITGAGLSASGANDDQVSVYSGIITNDSAGVAANGGFTFTTSGTQLGGCFAVAAPLAGSGPGLGRFESGSGAVSWTTSGSGTTIFWRGNIQGDGSFNGSYAAQTAGQVQHGHFAVALVATIQPPSDFTDATCPSDGQLAESTGW